MTTLHTFGCSITQGFALPDIVRPALDAQGQPLTDQEVRDQGIHWTDIHILAPSLYAWPSVLANQLNIPVLNMLVVVLVFNRLHVSVLSMLLPFNLRTQS